MLRFRQSMPRVAGSEPTDRWAGVVVLEGREGRWAGGGLGHGEHAREQRLARVQPLLDQ